MIRTDPSQTKTVIVLLLVLGAAVVWTVIRINPSARPQAAAAAAAEVAQVSVQAATVAPAFQPSRNPFRKPAAIRACLSKDARLGVDTYGVLVQEGRARSSGSFKLAPLGFGKVEMQRGAPGRAGSEGSTSAQTENPELARPQFALLAIVGGPDGFTAVIRSGESNTMVVAVGDTLEGGYKVQKLESTRAFLAKGRDVVEIKRPS